ncbi:Arginine ABC transporter, permease protein ArtM [Enterobacter hormaechei]|nr:Arginine ABC transporter, permease protein ArtM [Enterobacter hormaechei]
MLDYLPELMKGLHTSLTLTVASIIVALILALIFTIVLTLKNASAGVDCTWLHYALYRYAPAGANLPDLLRPGAVPVVTGIPGDLAPAL